MPVEIEGKPKGSKVTIDCSQGEWIRHTVKLLGGATSQFVLSDEVSRAVLCSGNGAPPPSSWSASWHPSAVGGTRTKHNLEMVFPADTTSYGWKVEHMDRAGNVRKVIRDVTYKASGPTLTAAFNVRVTIDPECA